MKYLLRRTSLAAAIAGLVCALAAPAADAMSLGALRVLSKRGDPLLAEIDIPQLTPDEMAIVRAGLGTPQEYTASGMPFDPAMQGVQITLLRRADGRYFLRLNGTRPVTSESLNVIMQLQAGQKSVWRDYFVTLQSPEPPAQTLALGLARVLSKRGEPLRAEIDVPIAPSGEQPRANVASQAEYAAAGIPYDPALGDVQMRIQKGEDGKSVVSVTTSKPVDEPSLNLVMDASWSSGRIVRDYALPLPPQPSQAAAPAPTPVAAPTPRESNGSVTVAAAPPPAVAPTVPASPSPAAATPSPNTAAKAVPTTDKRQKVVVKAGDTASKIANANKPQNVSLDQMLVATLKANPTAFAGGNVNRLRSGAVLEMPTEAEIAAVPADEATRVLSVQSRDFDEFRMKIAQAARPAVPGEAANVKMQLANKPVIRNRLALTEPSVGNVTSSPATQQFSERADRATQLTEEIKAMVASVPASAPAVKAMKPASAAKPAASARTKTQ